MPRAVHILYSNAHRAMPENKWIELGRALGAAALDLLFPPKCQVCGNFDPLSLCDQCRARIDFLCPPLCMICGDPLLALPRSDTLCAKCGRDTFYFDRCRSVAMFDGVMREAIHALKYHGKMNLARPLGGLMADLLQATADTFGDCEIDFVVPIPLHPTRLRHRGFNQSELLAREVALRIARPLQSKMLARIKLTEDQIGLSARQRVENVRGAFAINDRETIRDKAVLVIDDTFTTGATLNECAKVLRKAGAQRVFGLTLARQMRHLR